MHLAALLAAATTGTPWTLERLTFHVLWQIVGGMFGGWQIGRAFGWLTFHVPAETRLSRTGDGLIAISATLVSYGVVETVHAYGFLSVFVTALTFRHAHCEHAFHHEMHLIIEQVERLAMMVLLIVLAGALVSGLPAYVSWIDGLTAALILLVIRPNHRAGPFQRRR